MERKTVIETLAVLALAALLFNLWLGHAWLLYLATALLALAIFPNPLATLITKGWLKFSEVLGAVMSRLIMTLIFFFFLTPLAFVYRLFNRAAADHFLKKRDTYWRVAEEKFTKESFEKPW
ncbi:MAG TPA: SxtJ family membrane protein [bacterium]|nr:SxtJ family membrane protein [bacterium]